MNNIMGRRQRLLKEIGKNVRNQFKETGKYYNFVFLCGGKNDLYGSRDYVLNTIISERKDVKSVRSEELIDSVLNHYDLLTFEKVLADISQMILIFVESFGSACELGAFTYNDNMANKVVAVVKREHKNDQSFIIKGPISRLLEISKSRVFYEEFCDVEGRLTINPSTKFYRTLLDTVPLKRQLKKWFKIDDKTGVLEIDDLDSFFMFIIDYIIFLEKVPFKEIVHDIKVVFDVKHVHIKLGSDIKKEDYTEKVIMMCIGFAKVWKILTYDSNFVYFNRKENYENIKFVDFDYYRVLFTNDFLNSKKHYKIKSEAIYIAEKLRYKYGKIS